MAGLSDDERAERVLTAASPHELALPDRQPVVGIEIP